MANRITFEARALDMKATLLCGNVTFGGSGAVASQNSHGYTVSKPAGTGIYRITLEDDWRELIGFSAIGLHAAATDAKWQLQAVTLASKIIDVQYIGGAVAADAPSGAQLYLGLWFRDSTRPRKGGAT